MSMQFGAPQVTPLSSINMNSMNGNMPDMPDIPDAPDSSTLDTSRNPVTGGGLVDFGGLVESFKAVAPALDNANKSEQAFISGHGNMLEMVLERAKADTLLSLTSATASKVTQAASTLMNLQV